MYWFCRVAPIVWNVLVVDSNVTPKKQNCVIQWLCLAIIRLTHFIQYATISYSRWHPVAIVLPAACCVRALRLYNHTVAVVLQDNLKRESHTPYAPPTTVTWLPLLRKQTNNGASTALDYRNTLIHARSPDWWRQPRLANFTCFWSWRLRGIYSAIDEYCPLGSFDATLDAIVVIGTRVVWHKQRVPRLLQSI